MTWMLALSLVTGVVLVVGSGPTRAVAKHQARSALRPGYQLQAPASCASLSLRPASSILLTKTGETASSEPIDVDLLPDGTIAVLDRIRRAVRVFDRTGRQVREMKPSDPLMMSSQTTGLTAGRDGMLYIWDPAKQQVLRVDTDGRFSIVPLIGTPTQTYPSQFTVMPGGTLSAAIKVPSATREFFDDYVVTMDSLGRVIAKYGPFPAPSSRIRETRGIVATIRLADDLADRTVWTPLPDGRILGAQSRQAVLFALQQPDKPLLTLPTRSVALGAGDRGAALALAGTTNFDSASVRRMLPPVKAAIIDLLSGENWLFVRRPQPGEHLYSLSYDIVRLATMTYCATVKTEARMLGIRGDAVVGLQLTRDGQTRAVLFEIVGMNK